MGTSRDDVAGTGHCELVDPQVGQAQEMSVVKLKCCIQD